ncbi:MAG: hypothetical protein K0R25_176 [Rickettsiaceae bacterium]|jgi:hypothetical protein|nr:hypothetical protein [Rickettsiaceae bacterium]
MKINKTALNIITPLLAVVALWSCKTTEKPVNDCSMVFEESKDYKDDDFTVSDSAVSVPAAPASTCKVMSVKITDDSKCQIASSDSINNLAKSLDHPQDNRSALVVPLENLTEKMSYSDMMKYYFVKLKIEEHFDSELFEDIKDAPYKGMTCDIAGNKLTTWIGEGKAVVVFAEKEKPKASSSTTKKKTTTKKKSVTK